MCHRLGDTAIQEPGIELIEVLKPGSSYEEPLAHHADLVLDLTFFPSRRWRAYNRFNQEVSAHLLEAPAVGAIFADVGRILHGPHTTLDLARAGVAEEGENLVSRAEHHLLRLARTGPNKELRAVAKPNLGDLDGRGHPIDDNHLVAPVELVGFT